MINDTTISIFYVVVVIFVIVTSLSLVYFIFISPFLSYKAARQSNVSRGAIFTLAIINYIVPLCLVLVPFLIYRIGLIDMTTDMSEVESRRSTKLLAGSEFRLMKEHLIGVYFGGLSIHLIFMFSGLLFYRHKALGIYALSIGFSTFLLSVVVGLLALQFLVPPLSVE